jgi:hypothetical protein
MREALLVVIAFWMGVVAMVIRKEYQRRRAVARVLEAFADEYGLECTSDWWLADQRVAGEYRGASIEFWTIISGLTGTSGESSVSVHLRAELPDAVPSDLCVYQADDGVCLRTIGDISETGIGADVFGEDWVVRTEHPDEVRRLLASDGLCRLIRRTKASGDLAALIEGRAQTGGTVHDEASIRKSLYPLVDIHDAFAEAAEEGRDGEV